MKQDNFANNKRIAKNTMFLYVRMMITMVISLYTSRVILQVLGVDDFGIYQSVGGIVGFLSFINSALSTGSSRFITYGLGEGNMEKLKKVFNTTLTGHILLAIIIIIVALGCGYLIVNSSTTVGKAVTVVDRCVFTLPDGYSLEDSKTGNITIEHDGTSEKINVKEFNKNTTVKKLIARFERNFNDTYEIIGNNTTKSPNGIEIFTVYYKNSTDNLSSSFFYTTKHSFNVNTVGYNDLNALNKDLYYIADTLRPDYKQAQD